MKSQLLNNLISILYRIFIIVIVIFTIYISIPIKVPINRVELPKGSITNTISSLKNRGFFLTFIDKYILMFMGQPKSGEIILNKSRINRIDFLKKIIDAKGNFFKVTLIPGETKEIFFQDISKKYNLDYNKLLKYYSDLSYYPEAGILPDTYHLPVGIGEKNLVKFLVNETEKRYKKLSWKYLNRYNKKEWLIYLTIASIIQKEAGRVEEMPKISSVIYNRLIKNMPLQMDGTLNYGIYSHVKVTPNRIKSDKSRFNTYLNRGLPPYPVSSASIEAIKSALYPLKTDYLFFVKGEDNFHIFSKTYKEHLNNIRKIKY